MSKMIVLEEVGSVQSNGKDEPIYVLAGELPEGGEVVRFTITEKPELSGGGPKISNHYDPENHAGYLSLEDVGADEDIVEIRGRLEGARDSHVKALRKVEEYEDALKVKSRCISDLSDKLGDSVAANQNLQTTNQRLRDQETILTDEQDALREVAKGNNRLVEELRQQVENLNDQASEYQSEIFVKENTIRNIVDERDSFRRLVEDLRKQVVELVQQRDESRSRNEKLLKSNRDLVEGRDARSRLIQNLCGQAEGLTEQRDEGLSKIAELEGENTKLSETIDHLRSAWPEVYKRRLMPDWLTVEYFDEVANRYVNRGGDVVFTNLGKLYAQQLSYVGIAGVLRIDQERLEKAIAEATEGRENHANTQ